MGMGSQSAVAQKKGPFYLKQMFKYRKRKAAVGKYKPHRQCRTLIKKKHGEAQRSPHHGSPLMAKKKKLVPMAEREPGSPTEVVHRQRSTPVATPTVLDKPETLTASNSNGIVEIPKKSSPTPEISPKVPLPAPVNDKQVGIRKQVEEELRNEEERTTKKLPSLYFTFDEDEFAFVDMEPFLIAAEYALHGRMLLVEGHTDSKGNDAYNKALSIKRVEKIRKLMQDMGVPDGRISVVGYGEEDPDFENDTEEGRQKNRRVDFTIF